MSKFGDLIRGKSAPAPAVAPPAPAPEPVVVEAPAPEPELKDMSKKELEELGRTMGVELDRRLSQTKLVKQIEELQSED
jgi:3-oxoacyl-ACP reductase-like protein|tara:strand:+ start:5087 stop:5323 length:237 start_codon:yes stop_codon:yes gene_type:complete